FRIVCVRYVNACPTRRSSDLITRTFPIGGRFSAAQRDVYEIVLSAQAAAIAKVQPGCHWNEPHDAAVRVLAQGMLDLKLLDGTLDRKSTRLNSSHVKISYAVF